MKSIKERLISIGAAEIRKHGRALTAEKRVAVVLSLHELELTRRFSDTVLCVRNGRVDRIGSPEEIFQGSYITELYGVEHGSYDPLFGGVETQRVPGQPELFVIGGGGSGIPVYRLLQRKGIPFAAGVLQESDLDYPVAKALASELISVPAFEEISQSSLEQAFSCIRRCRHLVCTVDAFGAVNDGNKRLLSYAQKSNLVVPVEALDQIL